MSLFKSGFNKCKLLLNNREVVYIVGSRKYCDESINDYFKPILRKRKIYKLLNG